MKKLPFEKVMEAARNHTPDTSRSEMAFETRLLANIRESAQENGFLDMFGSWLWKGGLGLTPVAIVFAVTIFFHGINFPEGTSGVVAFVVEALPFSDSTLLSR